MESRKEPSAAHIIVDAGAAFAIGAVGGSIFHFTKGLRNAPNGARFAGGLEAMRMNVPRVAGSFAVWGGLFSACDCALVYARQKEDPWNSILAGAATGGILSLRQGFHAVVRSSMQGAILFALINGAGIMMQHHQSDTIPRPVDNPVTNDPVLDNPVTGLFGNRGMEEGSTNSSGKT